MDPELKPQYGWRWGGRGREGYGIFPVFILLY
jgi:hypothetical protein